VGLWEYRKIALNQLSAKTADVDLLNDAGEEGWELVVILPNNIAYLKREMGEAISVTENLDAERSSEPACEKGLIPACSRDPNWGQRRKRHPSDGLWRTIRPPIRCRRRCSSQCVAMIAGAGEIRAR